MTLAPQDCFLLYHPRSRKSGRALAEALGIPSGISLHGHDPKLIVRWGSQRPVGRMVKTVNRKRALALAADKLVTFTALREAGVSIPEFTTSRQLAIFWNGIDRLPVLGRTRHGRSGSGIHVYQPGERIGEHELYVKLVPSDHEYRVHVMGGEVIRTQRKQAGADPGVIRTHTHGFTYVGLESYRLNQGRYDTAIEAVEALGLDFGAVDLLIGQDGQTYVLEVNTAPAMYPLTLSVYANALRQMLNLAEWV